VGEDDAARLQALAGFQFDLEPVADLVGGDGLAGADFRRGVGFELAAGLGQHFERWGAIAGQEAVRVGGEAIARQAGVEHQHVPSRPAELRGGGEAGKTAAYDDDVVHGGTPIKRGMGEAGKTFRPRADQWLSPEPPTATML
jgi:hypothetical protein